MAEQLPDHARNVPSCGQVWNLRKHRIEIHLDPGGWVSDNPFVMHAFAAVRTDDFHSAQGRFDDPATGHAVLEVTVDLAENLIGPLRGEVISTTIRGGSATRTSSCAKSTASRRNTRNVRHQVGLFSQVESQFADRLDFFALRNSAPRFN